MSRDGQSIRPSADHDHFAVIAARPPIAHLEYPDAGRRRAFRQPTPSKFYRIDTVDGLLPAAVPQRERGLTVNAGLIKRHELKCRPLSPCGVRRGAAP